MASTEDFVEFVCEQIRGTGDIRYKKMFAEYMVYVDEKPVILICNNTVYVKVLPELASLLDSAEIAIPYDGAKERYVLEIDDAELSVAVVNILKELTPLPKKRKKA